MGSPKSNAAAPAAATSTEAEEAKVNEVETTAEEVTAEATAEETTAETAVATVETAEVQEAEVIPSGVFVAEDGTELEFAVKHFIYDRKKYTVEEALANAPEVLEALYQANSFIFKKL